MTGFVLGLLFFALLALALALITSNLQYLWAEIPLFLLLIIFRAQQIFRGRSSQ